CQADAVRGAGIRSGVYRRGSNRQVIVKGTRVGEAGVDGGQVVGLRRGGTRIDGAAAGATEDIVFNLHWHRGAGQADVGTAAAVIDHRVVEEVETLAGVDRAFRTPVHDRGVLGVGILADHVADDIRRAAVGHA